MLSGVGVGSVGMGSLRVGDVNVPLGDPAEPIIQPRGSIAGPLNPQVAVPADVPVAAVQPLHAWLLSIGTHSETSFTISILTPEDSIRSRIAIISSS